MSALELRTVPIFPGDLIKLNKELRSWFSRTHRGDENGEPKRWCTPGEIMLVLCVEPLNTRGTDCPVTTWLLTCMGNYGIEFLRAHQKSASINFTILSPGKSE